MGQRHQIFVIARVQGRYRCIAAFHSQWLYGGMVIKTAARLIRAFVNPINAAVIASELAILEGLDISVIAHENNEDYANPAVLCPYLTGLILTCSSVDMDEGRMYRMKILPTHCMPSEIDNDDGYTFFDLTEEAKPRYCFWWPGTGPLTAYEYLSVKPEADKQLAPSVYGIFGHLALLGLEPLAEVWPDDFRYLSELWQLVNDETEQTSERISLPNSPAFVHSAASTFDAIRETKGPDLTPELVSEAYGLTIVLLVHSGKDVMSRRPEHTRLAADSGNGARFSAATRSLLASCELQSAAVSTAFQMIRAVRASNPGMDSQGIASVIESLFTQPNAVSTLRAELLEAKTLGPNDICRLKQLIAAEQYAIVDLKPWFSTGALDAATLLDLSDALQHAIGLDLSLSSTLTAEIVEALVPRLPNLRHIIAFSCDRLLPLTTALPLTSYLTSLPVVDAIDQGSVRARFATSMPECLRWVEASDPPAGLTIVIRCPSLSLYAAMDSDSMAMRRYGVELSHFGAEGVIRGFTRCLERLYKPDYAPSGSGCYFEMRAYFHSNGSTMLRECIPTHTSSSPTYSFGCLPSLIRDASPEHGEAYPAMTNTTASGAVTAVPRHPGWVLTLDTKGTMPYHRNRKTVDVRTVLFKGGLGFFSPRKRRPKGAERSKKTGRTKGRVSQPAKDDPSPQSLPDQPGPSSATSPEEPEDDSPTPRAQCVALPALDDAAPQAPGGTSNPTPNDSSSSPPRDGASTPTPKDTSSAPPRDGASTPTPKNATAPPREAPRPEYAFERWDVVPGQNTKELRVVERVSVREWVGRLPAGHGAVPEALLSECEAVLSRLNVALRGPPEESGPVATD